MEEKVNYWNEFYYWLNEGRISLKKKKQFAAYFQACKSSFIDHHAPIDVTRVSNKDLKRKALQILWKNWMISDSSEYSALALLETPCLSYD